MMAPTDADRDRLEAKPALRSAPRKPVLGATGLGWRVATAFGPPRVLLRRA